jgi:hypothetical protein
MALKDLQTNLKSLRYNKDTIGGGNSGEPYVTTSIDASPGNTGGTDFTLRANTLARVGDDIERLNKLFNSNKGQLFRNKQNLLSRTGVKTQASGVINEGKYISKSTLLQAGANPFGIHLNKQGLNPFRDTSPDQARSSNIFDKVVNFATPSGLPVYTSIVTNTQSTQDNRLVNLKEDKVANNFSTNRPQGTLSNLLGDSLGNILRGINPLKNNIEDVTSRLFGNTKGISPFKGEMLRYSGGPGSALGVGQTVIKRYSNTTSYNTPGFRLNHFLLTGDQISAKSSSKNITEVSDFRKEFGADQTLVNLISTPFTNNILPLGKKNILSNSPDYSRPENRIEQRVNLGNPGRRNKNVSSYSTGLGEPLDKINALPLYKGENVNIDLSTTDLVKFRIGVIDNKNPNQKTYIHFRAFIDNFSDNYSAEWNAEKYMGRGENFYRYQGFDRTINLDWTIAAQSKEEIMIQYKKLNFLASSLAPDYIDDKYMAGNLVTLTLGGWCYEQEGFIRSLNLSVPQESPWEINIDDNGNVGNLREVPHIVKVTGFTFTPIHNFVPKVQTLNFGEKKVEYGKERYISLRNKKGDAYGEVAEGPKKTTPIDPPPPPLKKEPTFVIEGDFDSWTNNMFSVQTPINESSTQTTQGLN